MELILDNERTSDIGTTGYRSPKNLDVLKDEKPTEFFSPGDSAATTMAHTGVNTSFIVEEDEEQQSSSVEEEEQKPFDYFNFRTNYAEEDVLELPVEQYGK